MYRVEGNIALNEIQRLGAWELPAESNAYISYVLPEANSVYIKENLIAIGACLGKAGLKFETKSDFDKNRIYLKVWR